MIDDGPAERVVNGFWVWVALVAIVTLAVAVRAPGLGGPDFGIDEILHVYAADSLINGRPVELPDGTLYRRALPFTRAVALSGDLLGLDEASARLPSAIFGVLAVLVVFWAGRRWFSTPAGLAAAFLTAVIPAQVGMSRSVRMYALFQLVFLLAILLFYLGYESSPRQHRPRWAPARLRDWLATAEVRPVYLLLALIATLFALGIHNLMLPALFGPWVYVAIMAVFTAFAGDSPGERRLKYWVPLVLAAVVTVGALVFAPDAIEKYWARAMHVPMWAQKQTQYNWAFYRDAIAREYGVVFGALGLAALVGFVKRPRSTLYVMSCFCVPFLIQSVFLPMKAPRFVFHLLPLVFIVFGFGLSELVSGIHRGLVRATETRLGRASSRAVSATVLVVAVGFWLGSTEWFAAGLKHHRTDTPIVFWTKHNHWQIATDYIRSNAEDGDVLITVWPLLTDYYGAGLPTYFLNQDNLDNRHMAGTAGVIEDLESLREVVRKHPSGWVVIEAARIRNTPAVESFIRENCPRVEVPGAPDMAVRRWNTQVPPSE